jgi:hypothetical protein
MDRRRREELFDKLASDAPLFIKRDRAFIKDDERKFGHGFNNLVIGSGSIRTNNASPANPGFSLGDDGSIFRHGRHLDFDGDFTRIFFRSGDQQLNPLGSAKASSTTDPLPTIVPSMRVLYDPLLAKDAAEVLTRLGDIA